MKVKDVKEILRNLKNPLPVYSKGWDLDDGILYKAPIVKAEEKDSRLVLYEDVSYDHENPIDTDYLLDIISSIPNNAEIKILTYDSTLDPIIDVNGAEISWDDRDIKKDIFVIGDFLC